MDRRSFLQKFGMGIGAAILTPSLIRSAIITPESDASKIIAPDVFQWNSSQIFIRVINRNPEPCQIILFGTKKDLTDNPLPDGVTIQVAGNTILNLNKMILARPVYILGFKMISSTPMSADIHNIDIWNIADNGKCEHRIFQPLWYLDAHNNNSSRFTKIDAPSFELLLTPNIYLSTTIDKHQKVDYVFDIGNNNESIFNVKEAENKTFSFNMRNKTKDWLITKK